MNLSDFDYQLPEGLIAQYPLPERDTSRLLALRREDGAVRHGRFRDLCGVFRSSKFEIPRTSVIGL